MGDRTVNPFNIPGPEVLCRGLQGDKTAFKPPRPVRHQGDLPVILPVECRDKPEICQYLEAVADTQYQVITIEELHKILPQVVAHPVCIGIARTRVVAIGKTSGED